MELNHQQTYYQDSKDWYQEKYELIAISRNRYRLLAIGLGVMLSLSMIGIVSIMPL